MSYTAEQKQQIRNAVEDPNVEFVFIPSAELKRRIASGTDIRLSKLAKKLMVTILDLPSDQAIRLDKSLVLRAVEGTLDENHEYVFSLGEIRVLNAGLRLASDDNS
jgi:hypothetical protein